MEQMGDNVFGRKLVKFGPKLALASLALALTATSGALVMGSPADAATKAKPKPAAASPGRKLFQDWSCGSCHSLKDAGGTGHVGPELNGAKLSKAFVVGRITNGQGAMPSFGGQLTAKEIDALATYVSAQSNK
jgi:mono/diheme cytochrome c family protein